MSLDGRLALRENVMPWQVLTVIPSKIRSGVPLKFYAWLCSRSLESVGQCHAYLLNNSGLCLLYMRGGTRRRWVGHTEIVLKILKPS